VVLEELCPHCGNERIDDLRRPCPACGYEPIGLAGAGTTGLPRTYRLLLGLAGAAVVAVILVTGFGFRPQPPASGSSAPAATQRASLPAPPARLGGVVFAEGLDASMELEALRSQFAQSDTIAWRAEFVEAPSSAELTVVVAWQSIRERMELSRHTVRLGAGRRLSVVRDEVAIDDLVPTAGLYTVTYYEGDAKLAEGVFEVLPPDR
jgi:hypothetical protein